VSNIVKLNGSIWGSVVVDTEQDLDRIAHVLDDCGLRVERHEDGVFLNSDNDVIVLQFRVEQED
jgi:hypothetical protein